MINLAVLVRLLVAHETAGVGGPVVGDWVGSIHSHDVPVKVDEALASDRRARTSHSVCRVANGTRESIINVPRVLGETGVAENLREVVALGAHRIRTVHTQVRRRKDISNQSSWGGSRTDFIASL